MIEKGGRNLEGSFSDASPDFWADFFTPKRLKQSSFERGQVGIILADFDKIARKYGRLHRATLYHGLISTLVKRLARDGRVVEVGCGLGALSRRLAEVAREVIGIDGSAEMVARANQETPPNVRFVRGESSEIDLAVAPGAADMVVSAFVLHDQSDPIAHLRSWSRLLRANGAIVIVDRYWERERILQARSFMLMEAWIWRRLRKQGFGVLRSLLLFIEDLREWFSPAWRMHRRHEFQRRFSECRAILERIDPKARVWKLNSSSYLAIVHPGK